MSTKNSQANDSGAPPGTRHIREDRPGGHSAKNARQAGSSTTHESEGRTPMVRITNADCLALGCDWAWGAEPCSCGRPHVFRICARCFTSDDPVCDTDPADDTTHADSDTEDWVEVAA